MSALISELAGLAHKHQLVPFLGAGCSKPHVGVDWDTLTDRLKQQLSGPVDPNWTHPEVAEAFVEEHGDVRLAEVLADQLLLETFDDALGTTPLQVLALELRSVYTTNQDNVLELASESVGRPLKSVSTLDDLRGTRPGDRILYHFHGRPDLPETLVYTEPQYAARVADSDHFMNIRLRSDLLTKRFLFVGYSFRDATTQGLFAEMKERFGEQLKDSFLVAYRWSVELDELCRTHGVRCIDPSKHLSEATSDPDEALEHFLSALCYEALDRHTEEEIESIFSPKAPAPVRVANRHQIQALVELAKTGEPTNVLATFRATCDAVQIPSSLQESVATALVTIIRRATPDMEGSLAGAVMNTALSGEHILEVAAAYIAFANRLSRPNAFGNIHIPYTTRFPQAFLPLAAGRAVDFLESWGEQISDNFYGRARQWFDKYWSGLNDDYKPYIKDRIDRAWAQRHTTFENPIVRAERLGERGPEFAAPTFPEIREGLLAKFPKQFKTPPES